MKYAAGGITANLGEAVVVDVPIAGSSAGDGAGQGLAAGKKPAAPVVVKEDGEDILVDPPVRNLPQWEPDRWGPTRIAGPKTGMMLNWRDNGCNASTAAMTLRWFAEDCPAGKLPFPTKPGGSVKPDWYSPRMAECFWPNADPPGKVALDGGGRIDFGWIYAVAAHYLQSGGDLPRAANGDVDHPPTRAHVVSNQPAERWLPLLRKMLKTGPVIVGLGAPAGHFVLCHAIIKGALAIVDPGNVLYSAKAGGGKGIQNWQSVEGFMHAGKNGENAGKVRMPKAGQWPGGDAPGVENDYRAYNLVSGAFLQKILDNLISLTSLTYPNGARFDAAPASAPPAKKASEDKPKQDAPPKSDRMRFSAWTRTRDLLYKDPAHGGVPDYDRAGKFFDACQGRIDDLVMLQTINIAMAPKDKPDAPATGKMVWDSDFCFTDKDAPEMAKRLVDECHKRGIKLHAGYAVVDEGMGKGRRGVAFCKFVETASDDLIKDHASQCVQAIKGAGFDGLSFDLEINGLSTAKHAAGIRKFFTELSSQMGDLILSFAGYPFQTDGNAASLPNMNAVPFSLCKIGPNVLARPQAYRGAGESMTVFKKRLEGTIKCAVDDVGVPPGQFQIGVDYTGDKVFAAVKGDDMADVCSLAKSKGVGVCVWRLEWPGSPSAADFDKWNQALNDGKPVA